MKKQESIVMLVVLVCSFFLLPYPGTAPGQPLMAADEDIPILLQKQLIPRTFKPDHIEKAPDQYGPGDWAAVIDATWGAGMSTERKLNIFNAFWDTIDQKFACFQDLDVDWNSLKTAYTTEIDSGVSRGRFAAIMNHLALALKESHTYCDDKLVNWNTTLDPGVPLLYVGGWGYNNHFGACLTPLPDGSLVVYKSIPGHPLGLVPGDVVLGYQRVPWKVLYKQLIAAQLPITGGLWGCSESAYEHSWLISAGMNWHLFDTIDIVKYATGDTLHLSTSPLAGLTTNIIGTEQMDIPGVPKPNPWQGDYVSWGIITTPSDKEIGYIYVMAWAGNAGDEFYEAVSDLMFNHTTCGLIIDFRFNMGGNMFLSNPALGLLFNRTLETVGFGVRSSPYNHFSMINYDSTPYNIVGDPKTNYRNRIAVLTGPGAVSSGDQVALRMKFHIRARLFGKSTAAAFNSPTPLDLGNSDWSSRYAKADAYLVSNPGHYLTHDEFVVNEEVWLSQDDVAHGYDTVVQAAIDWITAVTATLLDHFHAEVKWPNIEIEWRLQEIDEGIAFVVTRSDDGGVFAEVDVDIGETEGLSWLCIDSDVTPGTEYVYRVHYTDGGERHLLFETEPLRTPAAGLTLYQNYPNPFNPSTTICFSLPEEVWVDLSVFDIEGRLLRTLKDEIMSGGFKEVFWDGRDWRGNPVGSGVYLYRLKVGKQALARKMILLK